MIVLFTFLIMPLVTVLNAISMFFTENAVVAMQEEILSVTFPVMLFMIGIFGPFCEEFVFRGMVYGGYVKSGSRFWAILLSALLFGLMHMNFNQFCYAFVLGIIFALINEVLESTWPAFICHAVVNTQNVIMLYAMNAFMEKTAGTGLFEAYDSMMN